MDLLVFALFLIAVVLFGIDAVRSKSLTAFGLTAFAAAFLATSPLLHR